MRCRDLEKIMPELVEGELDERTTRLAEEHIRSCPACAAERAAYAEALGALAQPRPMLEVPAELNTLELPERQGWAWLRPALATAAVAAIMAGIILMPQKQQQEPVVTEPPVSLRSSKQVKPPKQNNLALNPGHAPSQNAGLHSQSEAQVHTPKPIVIADVPKLETVRKVEALGIKRDLPAKNRLWFDHQPAPATADYMSAVAGDNLAKRGDAVDKTDRLYGRASDATEGSVVVVASDIEDQPETYDTFAGKPLADTQPAVVHIESTDSSTGETKVYDYSRDDQGQEQVIEIRSSIRRS